MACTCQLFQPWYVLAQEGQERTEELETLRQKPSVLFNYELEITVFASNRMANCGRVR